MRGVTTPSRQSRSESTIVTSAYQSRGDELDARKRRYVYAMSARVVLFGLCVLFLRNVLWALIPAMLLSMLLPWFAVVLANGGRKRPEMGVVYHHEASPLTAIGPGRTIDGD
jgi:hypothetical protein